MEDKNIITASYIDKCAKNRDKINTLIRSFSACLFEIGDYFHHQPTMNPNEVKTAREIVCQDLLISEVPGKEYPIDECILIPTEEQLAKGLDIHRRNVDPSAYGSGPERLLDEYLRVNSSL